MNRRRPAPHDDAGYSLIEVVVAAGMVAVLMAIFTTAILQVFRSSGQAEATAAAQSQIQLALRRIDREVRYASWISKPDPVGGSWYVEFASSDGAECLQLRLARESILLQENETDGQGILQLIRWKPGAPATKTQPDQTIASQLLMDDPFELEAAGVLTTDDAHPFTPDFQRLRVRLTARVGTSTATADSSFTALNTSRSTPATHTCSEGRPSS